MSIVLDTRFHIWFIMTVYYKMRQIFLQNVTAILLQNVTVIITKCDRYYYKMWQLLQNTTFATNCDRAVQHSRFVLASESLLNSWLIHYLSAQDFLILSLYILLKTSNNNSFQTNKNSRNYFLEKRSSKHHCDNYLKRIYEKHLADK